jgi:hypothetical protein
MAEVDLCTLKEIYKASFCCCDECCGDELCNDCKIDKAQKVVAKILEVNGVDILE